MRWLNFTQSSRSIGGLLAVQLKACEAVSEIITRAIQDGQSDGTYTALAWSWSRE